MSDEDQASKTEDASSRKLAQAKQKGQVAQSQEVKSLGVLFGGLLALVFFAPKLADDVTAIARQFIASPHAMAVEQSNIPRLMSDVTIDLAIVMAPILTLLFVIALVVTVSQVGWTFSWEKMQIDFSKFSIIKGMKRIFGVRALVEFAKGLVFPLTQLHMYTLAQLCFLG